MAIIAFRSVKKVLRDDYFSKKHWIETMHSTFKTFPLLASLIAPLSVLFDIPALSQPWYGFESRSLTDDKTSLILSAFSLFFNVVANCLLLMRFSIASRRGYTLATKLSMVFWILKVCVAMVNLIIFGASQNNVPGYSYLEGFWCAVVSCVLSCISALVLILHYFHIFDASITLHENDVRLRGKGFMLNVTFLTASLGVQGLVFSKIEHWTYLQGIYFSTVSMLTIGLGDFTPETTVGKILLFPFVLLSISQLAVVVSQIIDYFSQRSLNITRMTMHHIERERLRKEMAMDNINLNEELKLLQDSQRKQDRREEMINLGYSLLSFFALWTLGAFVFSRLEGWTYGNALYFNYVSLLTLGYGDFTPSSAAGRVVYIVYALLAVPIMTSFAVQSITNAMHLISEQNLLHRELTLRKWPDPVPHHQLLDEAKVELAQSLRHQESLERSLIDAVLAMDFATRKLLSASLEGHPKLLLKADTLVQLRTANYDYAQFVEGFHDVEVPVQLADYRRNFAAFLTAASDVLQLEGEERRLFQRRVKGATLGMQEMDSTTPTTSMTGTETSGGSPGRKVLASSAEGGKSLSGRSQRASDRISE